MIASMMALLIHRGAQVGGSADDDAETEDADGEIFERHCCAPPFSRLAPKRRCESSCGLSEEEGRVQWGKKNGREYEPSTMACENHDAKATEHDQETTL